MTTQESATDKASRILREARQAKPHVRYVLNDKQTVIGAWSDALNRYVCVACVAITGEWVSMPYEILVNGEPMHNTWTDI